GARVLSLLTDDEVIGGLVVPGRHAGEVERRRAGDVDGMAGCGGMPGQEGEGQQPDPGAGDEGAAPAAQSIGHGSRNADAAVRFAPFTRSSPAGDAPRPGGGPFTDS